MSGNIQRSTVSRQLAILNEALEEQKLSPSLEIDLKCAKEMNKLLTIVEEAEKATGSLDQTELRNIYDSLANSKESYGEGLEHLKTESFATRFFYLFSKTPWDVGEAARSQLITKSGLSAVKEQLDEWVSGATEGENRLEASNRIFEAISKRRCYFNVSSLSLKTFPDIFNNEIFFQGHYWSGWGHIDLQKNQLTELPESISNLPALALHLGWNRLTRLPVSIGNMEDLHYLRAQVNQITSVPESIDNLEKLEELELGENQLAALPANLKPSRTLDVSRNLTLTSIPNEILNLPSTCSVDLSGCGLSQTVLDNIRAVVDAPDYQGPTISYSRLEPRYLGPLRSIEGLLQDLSNITGRTLTLPNVASSPKQENKLQMWLSRLCDIADYKSGGDKKTGLANNVQDYLQKANDDPKFRDTFYAVIHDATETCGDRVALSLMHLGIAHDIATVDVKDMKKLADLLIKGVFVLRLLEDVARAKVASLKFVDEIEVFLGYPIMLKERLQLPINAEQMLYAACSNITARNLDVAEGFVREQLGNEEIVSKFLVSQDKWKEALLINYPEEVRKLEAQKTHALENASTSTDYQKIEDQFNAGLVELTKVAVI